MPVQTQIPEHLRTCLVCEAVNDGSGEVVRNEGREGYVCPTCLADYFYRCTVCNAPNHLALEYRAGDGEDTRICGDCAAHARVCHICNEVHDDRTFGFMTTDRGNRICGTHTMILCPEHEVHIEGSSCYLCIQEARVNIHDYSYRPPFKFLAMPDELSGGTNPCFYGVELEVEDRSRCSISNSVTRLKAEAFKTNAYFKRDGSLEEGYEIVTHPSSLAFHLNNMEWKKALSILRSMKFRSHDTSTCGLHVHASKRYLTSSEQIRLGVFVALNQERFEKLARRTSERWCKFKKLEDNEVNDMNYSESRYEAVNWTNDSTIEFRMFKGTLNENTFLATIELVDACMNFVKTITTPFLTEDNSNSGWDRFCEFVRDKGYTYLPEYMATRGVYTLLLGKTEERKDFIEEGC